MKPIYQAWFCHIDLTNVCWKDCIYCTRYNRHIRKDQRFFMSLDIVEKALISLEGFPGRIGIMGGEPTLHPRFPEVCGLLSKYYPREKLGLWTTGGKKYEEHKSIIGATFEFVPHNEHNPHQQDVCKHQPITVAIGDVVEPGEYRDRLIDECWVQKIWCPTIGPKGGFFCEVAYALDSILDGPGGYPIEPGWWKRTPEEFKDQVDRYCLHCGMPVPMEREYLKTKKEKFSPGNLALFQKHNLPRLTEDDVEIFDKVLSINEIESNAQGWDPGNYRGDMKEDGV